MVGHISAYLLSMTVTCRCDLRSTSSVRSLTSVSALPEPPTSTLSPRMRHYSADGHVSASNFFFGPRGGTSARSRPTPLFLQAYRVPAIYYLPETESKELFFVSAYCYLIILSFYIFICRSQPARCLAADKASHGKML